MTIDEYKKLYPEEYVWHAERIWTAGLIEYGMIQFDEPSANYLAGPFQGHFGFYQIIDHLQRQLYSPLKTLQQLQEQNSLSHRHFPHNLYQNPAKDQTHLQTRLNKLSSKQRKEWQNSVNLFKNDQPSTNYPISIRISGNDDSSYIAFFPNQQSAINEIHLLLLIQPINIKDILSIGFIPDN